MIYTDRESILDMAPILGTQLIYQLQGDSKEVSTSKWSLHTDVLPCSCPPYTRDPSNCTTYVYKEDIDLKTSIVSLKVMNKNEIKDPNGITKLTVPELKEGLRTRGLSINGNKPKIKARLVQYFENEEALDDDEMDDPDATVTRCSTTNATAVNSNATIVYTYCTTDTTVVSDSITGATVINGNATISSKYRTTDSIVTNGATNITTVVNSNVTVVYQYHTTDITVASGGITISIIINGDATISSQYQATNTTISNPTLGDVDQMNVAHIKDQLRNRGLRLGGNKDVLKKGMVSTTIVNAVGVSATWSSWYVFDFFDLFTH